MLNFKGNILTTEEKEFRLKELEKECEAGEVDEEFLPFLFLINLYPVVTTQCCCGHNGEKDPHVDFRSSFSEKDTIDKIIRPLETMHPGIKMVLLTECERLRYCLRLDKKDWKIQVGDFIEILKKASIPDCRRD